MEGKNKDPIEVLKRRAEDAYTTWKLSSDAAWKAFQAWRLAEREFGDAKHRRNRALRQRPKTS